MKVYVVMSSDWDDRRTIGAYSRKEVADTLAKRFSHGYVQEFDLDGGPVAPEDKEQWIYQVDSKWDSAEVDLIDFEGYYRGEPVSVITTPFSTEEHLGIMRVWVWASGEDRAAEIASALFKEFLAGVRRGGVS